MCVYDGISAGAGLFRLVGARRDQPRERRLQQRNPAPQVQAQVERDLLVARAAGVKPASGVADPLDQLPLDKAVHVFVGARHVRGIAAAFLENRAQRIGDGARIVGRQHARGGERLGPREAAGHVVFEERAIEAEGDPEVERRGIGRRIEAAGPECHEC